MIPKQLFASMKVKSKFQLDCGATCNILPLKQYVQAMGIPENIYLQHSNAINHVQWNSHTSNRQM